jgi:MFS-type transporter involved in bile tolerance (Atg22 family)
MNPVTLALAGAGLTGFALGVFLSVTGAIEMGALLIGLVLVMQVMALVQLKRARRKESSDAWR